MEKTDPTENNLDILFSHINSVRKRQEIVKKELK